MPRRLPVRPAKVFGNFFVLIVLCLMSFIYYVFIFLIYGPKAQRKYLLPTHLFLRGPKVDSTLNRLQFPVSNARVVFLPNDDDRSRAGSCVLGFPSR